MRDQGGWSLKDSQASGTAMVDASVGKRLQMRRELGCPVKAPTMSKSASIPKFSP